MEQVKEVPMLRSEQEFIDWWIANSPLPSEIYAWFKSHQQPFDEETTRGIIDIHFKTLGKALGSTGSVTVQEIKDSLIAALKTIHLGKALHTRGSDPLADEFQEEYQHEIAGKIYLCTSRAKHGVPCEHCKPECDTCDDIRQVRVVPEDKTINCPKCAVERGKQRREGAGIRAKIDFPNGKGSYDGFLMGYHRWPDRRSGEERRAE